MSEVKLDTKEENNGLQEPVGTQIALSMTDLLRLSHSVLNIVVSYMQAKEAGRLSACCLRLHQVTFPHWRQWMERDYEAGFERAGTQDYNNADWKRLYLLWADADRSEWQSSRHFGYGRV